jgi:hypothetical protein
VDFERPTLRAVAVPGGIVAAGFVSEHAKEGICNSVSKIVVASFVVASAIGLVRCGHLNLPTGKR